MNRQYPNTTHIQVRRIKSTFAAEGALCAVDRAMVALVAAASDRTGRAVGAFAATLRT